MLAPEDPVLIPVVVAASSRVESRIVSLVINTCAGGLTERCLGWNSRFPRIIRGRGAITIRRLAIGLPSFDEVVAANNSGATWMLLTDKSSRTAKKARK